MTTKEFIEKAILGGWKRKKLHLEETSYGADYNIEAVLLDPLSWKAVGKIEGWEGKIELDGYEHGHWTERMHDMIDTLINGGTIEDYLKIL